MSDSTVSRTLSVCTSFRFQMHWLIVELHYCSNISFSRPSISNINNNGIYTTLASSTCHLQSTKGLHKNQYFIPNKQSICTLQTQQQFGARNVSVRPLVIKKLADSGGDGNNYPGYAEREPWKMTDHTFIAAM